MNKLQMWAFLSIEYKILKCPPLTTTQVSQINTLYSTAIVIGNAAVINDGIGFCNKKFTQETPQPNITSMWVRRPCSSCDIYKTDGSGSMSPEELIIDKFT